VSGDNGNSGLAEYLKAALLATDAATGALMGRFRSSESSIAGMEIASWEKAPGELVTEADMESDEFIKSALSGPLTPGNIYSEEGALIRDKGQRKEDDRFWLVDPLCGTRVYAAGLGLFGVSVALVGPGAGSEQGNALELGVIAVPPLKERMAAVTGRGVTRNGKPWTSEGPKGKLADVLVGVSAGRFTEEIGNGLGWTAKSAGMLGLGSAPYGLFQLAVGRLGAQVFYNAGVEHIAAGAAVCGELGVSVTDAQGKPLNWEPGAVFPTVVCSWPSVHAEVLAAMAGQ
jgi:myo-inositol-1(or 4)-monophosphatase